MKQISKIQASRRILQIAKAVAQVQASNNKLTPLQIAKVQKTVGMILAASNIDQDTLNKIQSLQNDEKQDAINNLSASDDNPLQDDDDLTQQNTQKHSVNVQQQINTMKQNKDSFNKIKNKSMKSGLIKDFLKQHGISSIQFSKPMKVGQFFQVLTDMLAQFKK